MTRSRFLKIIPLLGLFIVASLLLSACSFSTTGGDGVGGESVDSSLFVTTDKGDSWRSITAIPSITGRAGSIANMNVKVLSADPQDSRAIYLGTQEEGLFYTYDIASGWNQVKNLPRTTINDVKVDPKNKCLIYTTISNQVYRSIDCSRTWQSIYFDSNTGVSINAIAIDHYSSNNIYIGTSRGEIIKSIDGGRSWRTIRRLNDAVSHLLISPLDSRLIFVATDKNNIFSFTSNTITDPQNSADIDQNFAVDNWTDLNAVLKNFDLGSNFKDIVINKKDGTIFIASAKVILRSKDYGLTWESLNLIQPEKEAVVNNLAVNPENSDELFYVTNTAFFRSIDGGATWITKKLPTKRAGSQLLIDFNNPSILYLGTKKIK